MVSHAFCVAEPLDIPLEWGAKKACVWPRPQPPEPFTCNVLRREGGVLVCSELVHVAMEPHRDAGATAWWRELQDLLGRVAP